MTSWPSEPCNETAHAGLAALEDGETLAHHGHVSFVEISKGLWRRLTGHAPANQISRVAPLLHRHLRYAWQRLAILIERRGVAYNEDLRIPQHGEIRLNAHTSGTVGDGIE